MPMPYSCRKTCCIVGCWCPPSVRRRFPPTRRVCALPCQRHIAPTISLNWSRPCMRSTKPILVLVHGWGMNARVFDVLAQLLADDFDVRALDLPGHGGRNCLLNNSLQSWADDLTEQVPEGSTVLGWSLGGQVVMRAALDHPGKLSRLILLASTPRFVADESWSHGVSATDLEHFGASLLADSQATLLRFLSLQTRGVPDQKSLLQQLRQHFLALPQARAEALSGGLTILRETDLRQQLTRLTQPTLVLHGALDALTPAAAGRWLAETLPNARYVEMARAAHAPHLSHSADVAAAIGGFAHDCSRAGFRRSAACVRSCRHQLRCARGIAARSMRSPTGTSRFHVAATRPRARCRHGYRLWSGASACALCGVRTLRARHRAGHAGGSARAPAAADVGAACAASPGAFACGDESSGVRRHGAASAFAQQHGSRLVQPGHTVGARS